MRFAAMVVLGLGLSVTAGLGLFVNNRTAQKARVSEAETLARESAGQPTDLTRENERLRKDLASARRHTQAAERGLGDAKREVEQLQEELEAARRAPAGEAEPDEQKSAYGPGEEWKAKLEKGPVFAFPEFSEALESVDWVSVSGNMDAMIDLIGAIASAQEKGEQPDPALMGNVQKHNSFLVAEYLKLQQHGVPGSRINGAFTHPSVMANAIAGTLAATGKPLSASQSDQLSAVGKSHIERDRLRLASYPADALALRKRVEEAKLKRDFFEAAHTILTPEQRDALSPVLVRGRIRADLFCEGLLYSGGVQRLAFTDPDDLAQKATSMLAAHLGLNDAARETVSGIVSAWVAGLPGEVLDHELDALGKIGLVKAASVTRSAEHMVLLLERIRETIELDEAANAKLLRDEGTMFLFRTTS